MQTKSCNLTEDEIKTLITSHGQSLYLPNNDAMIDRINYLNRRLKAFKEPETADEKLNADTDATNSANQQVKGWGQ